MPRYPSATVLTTQFALAHERRQSFGLTTSLWYGRRTRHRSVAGGLDQVCALGRIDLCGSAAVQCKMAPTEEHRGTEIQNQLLDDMKAEFQEFSGRRVFTDVEREDAPPENVHRPTAAPRAAAEEEDRASALIPTVPLSTSLSGSASKRGCGSTRSLKQIQAFE